MSPSTIPCLVFAKPPGHPAAKTRLGLVQGACLGPVLEQVRQAPQQKRGEHQGLGLQGGQFEADLGL